MMSTHTKGEGIRGRNKISELYLRHIRHYDNTIYSMNTILHTHLTVTGTYWITIQQLIHIIMILYPYNFYNNKMDRWYIFFHKCETNSWWLCRYITMIVHFTHNNNMLIEESFATLEKMFNTKQNIVTAKILYCKAQIFSCLIWRSIKYIRNSHILSTSLKVHS